MKKSRSLAIIAAMGLLAFATHKVQAALLRLTIKATATTQSEPVTNKSVIKYTTTKTAVGTQDVLAMLARIEKDFVPDSSKLVYDTTAVDTNVFTIRNRDDGIIRDVTSRFKFSRGEGAVTSGAIDDTIGTKSSIKDTFIGTFTFQPDSSNYFTIVGLAVDEREQSSVNTNEVKMNETIRLKGAGTGSVGGLNATVTGRLYGLWSTRTAVPPTNAAPESGSVGRSRAGRPMLTLPLAHVSRSPHHQRREP